MGNVVNKLARAATNRLRAGLIRVDGPRPVANLVLLRVAKLGHRAPEAINDEERVVAEATRPPRRARDAPLADRFDEHLASFALGPGIDSVPSQNEIVLGDARPRTNFKAAQGSASFSASVAPSFAKRANRTPGRPPSASTSRPASSASVTIMASNAAERPLIRALSRNVCPSSTACGRPGSTLAREASSTSTSRRSVASSESLPLFVVARSSTSMEVKGQPPRLRAR